MRIGALLTICLLLLPSGIVAADTANTEPGPEALLASVRVVVDEPQASVNWLDVSRAIEKLGRAKESAAKPVLIAILQREAPLALEEGSPLPGVMPPLEMVKAAAIDALVKLQAREAVPDIENIARTTEFEALEKRAAEALATLQ